MVAGFDIPGYVDVEQIGAGGFGRVFRARQPAFDRTVAIKLLNGRLDDAATVRRFQRECQALGSVSSHPNIVPIYDAGGTPGGEPYLVMDYVRGGSLADRLQRSGPLPWPEVAMIGIKISGALHSAHLAGVLHRDIKPENILVSGYGEPQLADFGIAQRAGIENRTTTAAAMTPSHTAPEQFAGHPPSEQTDIYSLASTLFTLLSGATPFQGRSDESIFALIARSATDPVPDLRPRGVPDALARVVEAGLAKDPADRPASAVDFGRRLQEAQQALGAGVTPLPVAQDDGPAFRPTGFATLPPSITPGGVTPGGVTPGGFTPGGYPPPGHTPGGYPPPGYTPPGITPGGSPPPGYPPQPTPSPDVTRARFPAGPAPHGVPQGVPPYPAAAYGPPGQPAPPPPGSPADGGPPPDGGRRRLVALVTAAVVLVVIAVGITVALTRGDGTPSPADARSSSPITTPAESTQDTGNGSDSTDASGGTTPETSPDTSTSASDEVPSDGGTDTSSPPSTGGALQDALLTPGEAPLDAWTDGNGSLLGSVHAEGTDFFCGRTINLAGDKASTTFVDDSQTKLVDEHVYRVGASRAKQALGEIRSSARCGSWTDKGTKITVTPGSGVTAGDEAVAYAASAAKDGVPLETYQAFARRGGDIVVVTLVVVGAKVSTAERDLVAKAAAAAVHKLGG